MKTFLSIIALTASLCCTVSAYSQTGKNSAPQKPPLSKVFTDSIQGRFGALKKPTLPKTSTGVIEVSFGSQRSSAVTQRTDQASKMPILKDTSNGMILVLKMDSLAASQFKMPIAKF